MSRILYRHLLKIASILLVSTYLTVNATTLTHSVISSGGNTVIDGNIFFGSTIGQPFTPVQTSQFIAGFWHGQETSTSILPVALIVDGSPIASTCGTFDVTIQVQAPKESPVIGAELYLEYDENVLQVVNIKPGSRFDTVFNNFYDNKHVEFAAYDLSGASSSGQFELLTIEFKVKSNWSGTSPTILTFDKSKTEVYSEDNPPKPLLQSLKDIQLPIVKGATNIPVQVKIAQLGVGRANMPLRVRIDPSSPDVQHIKTMAKGNFTLDNLTPGQIVYVSQTNTLQQKQTVKITKCNAKKLDYELVRGDVSGKTGPDNLINMSDAFALRSIILSNTPEPNKDYNLDGQVTQTDQDPSFIQVHFDLNDDNKIDRLDPPLLSGHFNRHGDEINPSSSYHLKKGIKELLDAQTTLFPSNLSSLFSSGESFDVVIDVQAGNHEVIAAEAYFDFDPSLLRVNYITASGQLDTEIHNFFDNNVGIAEFAAIHLKENGITGTFKLMVINVTILGKGGEQTLTLNQTQTKIWGEDNQVLPDVPVKAIPHKDENPSLTVNKQGNGTVTDDQGKIDCGTTCRADYPPNTTVVLTATPAAGSSFTGWQGACSGTEPTAEVILDNSKECTAHFFKPLAVTLSHSTLTPLVNGFRLNWQTSYEENCAGFHVWRAWVADGQCWDKEVNEYQDITQLTEQLLTAKGEGSSYIFDDLNISPAAPWRAESGETEEEEPSYCYGLEEVHFDGSSSFYLLGPDLEEWVPLTD